MIRIISNIPLDTCSHILIAHYVARLLQKRLNFNWWQATNRISISKDLCHLNNHVKTNIHGLNRGRSRNFGMVGLKD